MPTPLLTREETLDLLGADLRTLGECLSESVDRYHDERAKEGPVGTTTRACMIFDFASELALEKFVDRNDVRLVVSDRGQLLAIVFSDRATVRFKKLNRQHQISAIPTGRARAWAAQQPLDEFPDTTNLVAGYRLDELGEIIELALVCSLHGRELWSADMEDPDSGTLSLLDPKPAEDSSGDQAARSNVRSTRKSVGDKLADEA